MNETMSIWRKLDDIRQRWEEDLSFCTDLYIYFNLTAKSSSIEWEIGSPEAFSGASMIKTFIILQLSQMINDGVFSWDDLAILKDIHKTDGDGLMKNWQAGTSYTLRDLSSLMIALSDNTATNVIIEYLGGTCAVNSWLASEGFRSRLNAWVGGNDRDPQATSRLIKRHSSSGLSLVYPKEHLSALKRIAVNKDQTAFRFFLQQQDLRSLARAVPEDIAFAHKTGTVYGLRHDSGIISTEQYHLEIAAFTDWVDRPESIDDKVCVTLGKLFAETFVLVDALSS